MHTLSAEHLTTLVGRIGLVASVMAEETRGGMYVTDARHRWVLPPCRIIPPPVPFAVFSIDR